MGDDDPVMNDHPWRWFGTFVLILAAALVLCVAMVSMLTVVARSIVASAPSSALASNPALTSSTLQPVPTLRCAGGGCAAACLSQLSPLVQAGFAPEISPRSPGARIQGIAPIVLAVYGIRGDTLLSPRIPAGVPSGLSAYQQDTAAQQKIWSYFAAIIPADQRTELVEYVVATDGRGGMLASVAESSNQPQDWVLSVDIADAAKPRDLTFTLLHEFGHLLSLNDSQVTPDPVLLANPESLQLYEREAAACSQFIASGGCSKPNSYLNRFYDAFWPGLMDQWGKVNAAKGSGSYTSLLTQFYKDHASQFISPYAATSPEEDIAESWAHFVLAPRPARDSIAHSKVLFFYNFPELVNLRSQIIYGICNYAGSQQ